MVAHGSAPHDADDVRTDPENFLLVPFSCFGAVVSVWGIQRDVLPDFLFPRKYRARKDHQYYLRQLSADQLCTAVLSAGVYLQKMGGGYPGGRKTEGAFEESVQDVIQRRVDNTLQHFAAVGKYFGRDYGDCL